MKLLAARRVLLYGPFAIRDLVLTKQPQTPKGCSPYAGPYQVIKVVGRYTYRLSDGQKWNCCHLKRYLPNLAEWTELAPQFFIQPQGGVGVAGVEEATGAEEAEDVGPAEDGVLPGPVAVIPRLDTEAEPRYLGRDRCLPNRLMIDAPLSPKRRRKK